MYVGELQGQYRALGDQVQQTKLEHLKAQMAQFKSSLEEFALKHRSECFPSMHTHSLTCLHRLLTAARHAIGTKLQSEDPADSISLTHETRAHALCASKLQEHEPLRSKEHSAL